MNVNWGGREGGGFITGQMAEECNGTILSIQIKPFGLLLMKKDLSLESKFY